MGSNLTGWLLLWSGVEWVIRIGMIPVVLRRRFQPSTALSWLLLVFALPEVGAVLYMLIGRSFLVEKRAQRHRIAAGGAREARGGVDYQGYGGDAASANITDAQWPMVKQAQHVGGHPVVGGNHVELVQTNGQLVAHLERDIDAAEHHVHLLYYIFRDDETGQRVGAALARAATRGVHCRLIADATGSRPLFRSALYHQMHGAGVEIVAALPVAPWRRKLARIDLRNHRKVAVVDGTMGYLGSHNMVVEDYGSRKSKWVDLSARITGPVVRQIQGVFLDDWAFETDQHLTDKHLLPSLDAAGDTVGQVVATGPSYEAETFRRVLVTALHAARERIVMTTPYLVPDEPTRLALAMAADRGVEVHIVAPLTGDHPIVAAAARSYFGPLTRAGIHIHLYPHGLLHAKTITIDDQFAMLGSANLDIRSFCLNFESNILLYGPAITAQLRDAQMCYLNQSEPLDLDAWEDRPLLWQYFEHSAALLSPLL